MSVEYTKNLVGKPIVKFDCPQCQLRLSAMLSEAGTHDKCPECGQGFKVPGQQKLKQVTKERRLAQEARVAAKSKKSGVVKPQKMKGSGADHNLSGDSIDALVARTSGQKREGDERWLIDPEDVKNASDVDDVSSDASGIPDSASPDSSSSGSSEVAVLEHGVADDAEKHGGEVPRSEMLSGYSGAEQYGHSHPRGPMVPSSNRGWWKDSIRFESVSGSRYPALMAFRNLMVLFWWIMMVCFLLAVLGSPFLLIYNGYSTYIRANAECDLRLEMYNNPTIDGLLAASAQGKGLTAQQSSRLLDELSAYQYRGFQAQNRLNRNERVSPQVLVSLVADWQSWLAAEQAEINRDRPSLVMAILEVVLLLLLCWIGLFVSMVIYSVVILVPPECIKLFIDIEHGVRIGNASSST